MLVAMLFMFLNTAIVKCLFFGYMCDLSDGILNESAKLIAHLLQSFKVIFTNHRLLPERLASIDTASSCTQHVHLSLSY